MPTKTTDGPTAVPTDPATWHPLTGAPDADAAIPAATALAWAVRTGDAAEIETALEQAISDGPGLRALAVLLAALVPDDESPRQLLGWRVAPGEYLRLRENGFSRADATNVLRMKRR